MKLINKQKGVSIFLAIVILTSILAIALGVTSIILPQIKTSGNISDSIKAVFAADTGIECSLYNIRKTPTVCDGVTMMTNNTSFASIVASIACPGMTPLAYRGISRQVYRALEICY